MVTVWPWRTVVPAAWSWATTMSGGFVFTGRVFTFTTSPRPSSWDTAASSAIPTTSGMAKVSGPSDTTRSTVDPFGSWVPALGSVRITSFLLMVAENSCFCWPTWNPSACSVLMALAADCPETSGTGTRGGPLLTTRVTLEPRSSFVAGSGFWEITFPLGTDSSYWTLATGSNPASESSCSAFAWLFPTTSGTGRRSGPFDSTKRTSVLVRTRVPGGGLSEMTEPLGTSCENWYVVLSPSPAASSRVVADSSVNPTTRGTCV